MFDSIIHSTHIPQTLSIDWVGGKCIQLAKLAPYQCQVPAWFCLSTEVFEQFLRYNNIRQPNSLQSKINGQLLYQQIIDGSFPPEFLPKLQLAIDQLLQKSTCQALSVRSSATVEDSLSATYAGQFDTFLGVTQRETVLEKIKACWASLWSDRAINYRSKQATPAKIAMAVIVQDLIPADVSGIMFTANPDAQNSEHYIIEASWGLGETIVSGQVTPDHFTLRAPKGEQAEFKVISAVLGQKHEALLWSTKQKQLQQKPTFSFWQKKLTLNNTQLFELAKIGALLEAGFGHPQDIEWAIYKDQIYILQSRPVTVC